jgi:predicted RNase H-like HicB family nuclease
MVRSRREALWDRVVAGDLRNVGFAEFRRLVEAFGFELQRVSGSHDIFRHPQVRRPLSLQPRNRQAKPYQIAQFGLKMERRRIPKYHINLFWSELDRSWVADVPDLQSCSAFGDTPAEALAEVEKAMEAWLTVVQEDGLPIPEPRYRATRQATG